MTFPLFVSVPPSKCQLLGHDRFFPQPFKFITTIVQTPEAIQSESLTASLNKLQTNKITQRTEMNLFAHHVSFLGHPSFRWVVY